MKFPIDIAVEEVVAAVKAEGEAYEEDDSLPYVSIRPVSSMASAIEFSLDTGLVETSGILLTAYDESLSLVEVYVADFDPGSFRMVSGERVDLTAHAFVLDLVDTLARSSRIAHARVVSEWAEALSFEFAF